MGVDHRARVSRTAKALARKRQKFLDRCLALQKSNPGWSQAAELRLHELCAAAGCTYLDWIAAGVNRRRDILLASRYPLYHRRGYKGDASQQSNPEWLGLEKPASQPVPSVMKAFGHCARDKSLGASWNSLVWRIDERCVEALDRDQAIIAVTLTYSDTCMPPVEFQRRPPRGVRQDDDRYLLYDQAQVRKFVSDVAEEWPNLLDHFAVREYGDVSGRLHWHLILFFDSDFPAHKWHREQVGSNAAELLQSRNNFFGLMHWDRGIVFSTPFRINRTDFWGKRNYPMPQVNMPFKGVEEGSLKPVLDTGELQSSGALGSGNYLAKHTGKQRKTAGDGVFFSTGVANERIDSIIRSAPTPLLRPMTETGAWYVVDPNVSLRGLPMKLIADKARIEREKRIQASGHHRTLLYQRPSERPNWFCALRDALEEKGVVVRQPGNNEPIILPIGPRGVQDFIQSYAVFGCEDQAGEEISFREVREIISRTSFDVFDPAWYSTEERLRAAYDHCRPLMHDP